MTRRGLFATIAAAFAWRKPNGTNVKVISKRPTRIPVDIQPIDNYGLIGLRYYQVKGNDGMYMGIARCADFSVPNSKVNADAE